MSEQHRKNLSNATLNHIVTEETRIKMSLSNIGKKRSPETSKRISHAMKHWWNKTGIRKRMSEAAKHRKPRNNNSSSE